MAHNHVLVNRLLREARELVRDELDRLFRQHSESGYGPLYEQMADYPFRRGKGLRPAIVLATCRAVGGQDYQAATSAAALELFHNGALLHDDIEDVSEFRRGGETLFRQHGVPIAINVGDATNVFSLSMLLRNVETLGVRKALQVLTDFEQMSRESVEGQAIELDWIRNDVFDLDDDDYVHMACKKTCWYTVIAPLRIGMICGSSARHLANIDDMLKDLLKLGYYTGIAFQIQDDLLNLTADEVLYGKEISGDLYEGKRTVMLLHFLRTTPKKYRDKALHILKKSRPDKSAEDIHWLHRAINDNGSIDYGREVARAYTRKALAIDQSSLGYMPASDARQFLSEMLYYVIDRLK